VPNINLAKLFVAGKLSDKEIKKRMQLAIKIHSIKK